MEVSSISKFQSLVKNQNYIKEVIKKLSTDSKNKTHIEYLLRNTKYKNINFESLPNEAVGKALIFAKTNISMIGNINSNLLGIYAIKDMIKNKKADEELLKSIERITLKYS